MGLGTTPSNRSASMLGAKRLLSCGHQGIMQFERSEQTSSCKACMLALCTTFSSLKMGYDLLKPLKTKDPELNQNLP